MHKGRQYIVVLAVVLAHVGASGAQDAKLIGTPIGSSPSVEYVNFTQTTTQNLPADAFDGDMNTYFASWERSYTWVGLDLGSRHVITRVGWSPRNDGQGAKRVQLGVFEGANREDFMDAMPLYVNDKQGTIGKMDYADVECSLGFRYVRYIGPNDARCNVAEIEFYGHEGEGDSTQLYRPTNLPCVVIHTKDNVHPWDKETYIESVVTILSESKDRFAQRQKTASLKDEVVQTVVLQDSAGVRLRGNASKDFPKKPYRIKFANKHRVLGSPAKAKNWSLINNYGDKSLMRNNIAFRISEACGLAYTPFCEVVDVLFNGEYKGCYQLSDKIDVRKGRVEIDEMQPTDIEGEALTGGYLWEIDAYAYNEPQPYYSPYGISVTLHSPEDDEIVWQQRAYFEDFYSTMEDAVFRSSIRDTTWRQYVDHKSFAQYFLANQMSGNPDWLWSCYMYKQRGDEHAYTGPVWDFDLGFDNDNRIYPIANHSDYIYGIVSDTHKRFAKHIVFADTRAKLDMKEYWHVARNSGIDAETLEAFVDSLAAEMDESQRLNFIRWPILSQYVHQNPVALGSFSKEVKRIKDYIRMRIGWMDNKLGYEWHPMEQTAVEAVGVDVQGYKVYDLFGRKVYEGTQLPELPEGIYIIQHNNQTTKLLQ